MKKRLSLVLVSLLAFVLTIGLSQSAMAASGDQKSVIQWDANGVSQTGATNRSSATRFNLRVMRANHSTIGQKTVTIGKNRQDYHTAWGQPALDRYGEVRTACPNYDPWFNP